MKQGFGKLGFNVSVIIILQLEVLNRSHLDTGHFRPFFKETPFNLHLSFCSDTRVFVNSLGSFESLSDTHIIIFQSIKLVSNDVFSQPKYMHMYENSALNSLRHPDFLSLYCNSVVSPACFAYKLTFTASMFVCDPNVSLLAPACRLKP